MIRKILVLILTTGLLAAGLVYSPVLSFQVGDPVALHQVTVKARDLSLVCPGPAFYSGGSTGTSIGKPKQEGTAELQAVWDAAAGRTLSGASLNSTPQGIQDKFLSFSTSSPYILTVSDPAGESTQGSNLLTGVQLDSVSSPHLNGLLGSVCQRPQSEFWIVGGDTTTGREALLILANPASIDATVELDLIGAGGALKAPGLSGISLAAHQVVVIPVSSLSPKNSTFSVHVKTRGAALAGWMQQKTVRGLTAAGADLIAPTGSAAKNLVIPGFFVRGSKDADKLQAMGQQFSDLTNFVRITNPTATEATAVIQVIGATAKTFGTVLQAKLAANSTADIEVTGLADGDYSVFVSSPAAILASAKLNRTSLSAKQKTDFAWLPAVDAQSGSRTFVVPKAGISKLSIANPSKQSADLVLRGGGLSKTVQIKAGATLTFPVNASSVIRLDSSQKVSASIVVDVDFTVAVLPMLEQRNLGGQVGVLVR